MTANTDSAHASARRDRQSARRFLDDAVASEAPRYMAIAAGVVAVFSTFNALYFHLSAAANALHALATAAVVLTSVVVGHVPARLAPWAVAAAATVVCTAMLAEVYLDPTEKGMGYVLLVLVACGPFILATTPVLTWSALELLACVPVAARLDDQVGWWVLCAAALVVGAVLGRARASATVRAASAGALLLERADQDDLTGLLNRRGLDRRWPSLVAAAARRQEQVVAVFIDIDGFKHVNDRFGHERGDAVLVAVSGAIRAGVRGDDLVARWGGDEFLVIGAAGGSDPADLAARILDQVVRVAEPLGDGRVSISTGSAQGPAVVDQLDDLVGRADADMYLRRRAARSHDDGEPPRDTGHRPRTSSA